MSEPSFDVSSAVPLRGTGAPSVAWLPRDAEGSPVVLLGHGGSGNKTSPRHRRLARMLTDAGVSAVAIDGPHHGDRVRMPLGAADYQSRMAACGMEQVIDEMSRDWLGALQAAREQCRVNTDRLGYIGLSMGSRFGIPLAAALGGRLRAAVFGKFGLQEHHDATSGLGTPWLHRQAAAKLFAPVMMHVQWDDEVFPRAGALELFDAFAAPDRVLVARPGRHRATHDDDERNWAGFVLRHLTGQMGR